MGVEVGTLTDGLGVAVVLTGAGVVRFVVGDSVTFGPGAGVTGSVTFKPLESQLDNTINNNTGIKINAARRMKDIIPVSSFLACAIIRTSQFSILSLFLNSNSVKYIRQVSVLSLSQKVHLQKSKIIPIHS